MSAFAVHLDRLLVQLGDLPSSSPPHLTHLTIRLERAYTDLRAVGTPAPAELFIRIRGRLQELGEGLKEAQSTGGEVGEAVSWGQLEADARQVELEVAALLEDSARTTATADGHSRTLSADLPRRLPSPYKPSHQAPAHPATSAADLSGVADATNSRSPISSPPPMQSLTPSNLMSAFYRYHICTEGSSLLPEQTSMVSLSRELLASRSYAAEPLDPIRDGIAEQLKRAYFEPFEASLSSTTSTVAEKAEAWDALWQDVRDAVLPLANMYISLELGEESAKRFEAEADAPLNVINQDDFDASAALARLEMIVRVLEQCSGPLRSETVWGYLDDIVFAKNSSEPSRSLVGLMRRLLDFVDMVKDDLRADRKQMMQAVSDATLERMVLETMREAGYTEERGVVWSRFGGPAGIGSKTRVWLSQEMGSEIPTGQSSVLSKDWVAKALVKMLFKNEAVDFSNKQNRPPPIFFIPSFALVYLQNQFQALVVVACLATLVGTAPPPSRTTSAPPADLTAFVERVWTILQAEIGPTALPVAPMAGGSDGPTRPVSGGAHPSATRIANLADEVHRALATSGAALSGEEETRLRASVKRILRYEDPVYKLLKSRLESSVEAALVDFVTQVRATLLEGFAPSPPPRTLHLHPAKGFERPAFLRNKVEEVVQTRLIANVWEWMEKSWSDVMGWTT
ncbi:T-complex 11 family protein [Rhodotorula toruloides]|uniref:T-complex 11 family protein n=1 Tax=Rhodotorula toruloides TaxID=5286 RepID=A0A511KEA7_RHOTO|nr:T-complex 11 family protein [Rhodotorula toruloides]